MRHEVLIESCEDGWWWEIYRFSYPTVGLKQVGIAVRESLGESPTTFDSRAEAIADAERRVRELNIKR